MQIWLDVHLLSRARLASKVQRCVALVIAGHPSLCVLTQSTGLTSPGGSRSFQAVLSSNLLVRDVRSSAWRREQDGDAH